MTLRRGLYETLLTEELRAALDRLATDLRADTRALHPSEAGDRIAIHVAGIIERALAMVNDCERLGTDVRSDFDRSGSEGLERRGR